MRTDREDFRSMSEVPEAGHPIRYGSVRSVTGGRCVPKEREISVGTAGRFSPLQFAVPQGAFQVLIRLQHLRTQIRAWTYDMRAVEGGTPSLDIYWSLRGITAAARHGGLLAYAHMCARVAQQFEPAHGAACVAGNLLTPLGVWLATSESYLRHPGNSMAAERLDALVNEIA